MRRNLSYVLHEPSGATIVRDYAERARRETQWVERSVRRLAKLSSSELGARLVSCDVERDSRPFESPELDILSVKVGAWELLPRIVQASGVLGDVQSVRYTFVDDSQCEAMETLQFFRAEARLCLPAAGPSVERRWVVATAAVRPAGESIHFRYQPVLEIDRAGALRTVVAHLETTVREFVAQWACERPLWELPAEQTLPEFS